MRARVRVRMRVRVKVRVRVRVRVRVGVRSSSTSRGQHATPHSERAAPRTVCAARSASTPCCSSSSVKRLSLG